jgi:peroxiredoxin
MRKFAILLLAATCFFIKSKAQSGHAITVEIKNWKDTTLYLGNYYGQKTYLYDSARLNRQGIAVFKGSKEIPPGIYFVLMPDKQKYFEMLIPSGKQHFSVTADTTDLINKVQFQHSEDNDLFYAYNRFLSDENKKIQQMKANHQVDSASLRDEEKKVNDEINQYRDNLKEKRPSSMLAMIFAAMEDPKLPPGHTAEKDKKDSLFAYYYTREHYWDHINFKDSTLLRTPILEGKLQTYFTRLVPPIPDSIDEAADALLTMAKANKAMHKFVLWWLTYTYEASPYMGMDAVFVHLVEKYYLPPAKVDWLSDKELSKIIDRAYSIAPNLIGNEAPDIHLYDSLMHPHDLYDIKSKYTLLVFWDPTCGHCIIEVPQMDSAYRASWKKMGVTMVGIRSDGTKEQWEDFIQKHHLTGWHHWWDPDDSSNFRQLYDVYSTPVTYLLDANKKIIAKRLGVDAITDFLEHQQGEKKQKAKKHSTR